MRVEERVREGGRMVAEGEKNDSDESRKTSPLSSSYLYIGFPLPRSDGLLLLSTSILARMRSFSIARRSARERK
jgi:hypothetical protein